jgi:DNA-binding response OmpR family regulator
MEELIVRLENALRSRGSVAESPTESVTLGKYQFNSKRQTLALGLEERKLSFRESELLRLMYANRDRVIERKEILNLLWGSDSFFNSRNLDVYITKLRGYLKDDDRIEIITIKGVGYRFVTY